MARRYRPSEFVDSVPREFFRASSIAEGLGISYWTLRQWRKEYIKNHRDQPEPRRRGTDGEEIKRLKEEIANLKMDNAILKKYAAMLSRDD